MQLFFLPPPPVDETHNFKSILTGNLLILPSNKLQAESLIVTFFITQILVIIYFIGISEVASKKFYCSAVCSSMTCPLNSFQNDLFKVWVRSYKKIHQCLFNFVKSDSSTRVFTDQLNLDLLFLEFVSWLTLFQT